jgi:NAD+--asparagine ADP-ribosyltransferase
MNVKILYIKDKSDIDNERIVLYANEDCDIGNYMIFDTYSIGEGISTKIRHTYWFPDKKIKKGDKIIIYTKKGKNSSKENSLSTSHFFYWGIDRAIWIKEEECAVLMEISEYDVFLNK